jgi:hypothetical protein
MEACEDLWREEKFLLVISIIGHNRPTAGNDKDD